MASRNAFLSDRSVQGTRISGTGAAGQDDVYDLGAFCRVASIVNRTGNVVYVRGGSTSAVEASPTVMDWVLPNNDAVDICFNAERAVRFVSVHLVAPDTGGLINVAGVPLGTASGGV